MHDRDYAEINIVSREHQQYLSAQKIRKVDNSVFPCYTVLQLIGGLVNAFTKLDKMPKDRSVFYPAFLYNREFQEEMI